jgi:uncharacterized repeat protein (TIGR03803 family)
MTAIGPAVISMRSTELMQRSAFSVSLRAALTLTAVALFASGAFAGETVLYRFTGGSDGGTPNGPLITDNPGNLYGTTLYGGRYGYGSVFRLAPPPSPGKMWTETVLYSFLGGIDGSSPSAGLVADSVGNLYGTAPGGGRFNTGVVYRLSPPRGHGSAWKQTVIFTFDHHRGDGNPAAGLIFDGAGNLYGSSVNGGAAHRGTIFELVPGARGREWSMSTLYTFGPCSICGAPSNGLAFDPSGALYGLTTAQIVGSPDVAFRLTPPATKGGAWTYADLHDFGGQGDGDIPVDSPTLDSIGNIYGTTESGGIGQCQGGGCGTVFELSPPAQPGGAWTEKLLYIFTGGVDGGAPLSTLIMDATGNLYGTTVDGGEHAYGTAFELVRGHAGKWTERVLHSFATGGDGQTPQSGMLFGKDGALYGTTPFGGAAQGKCAPHGCGTIYRIAP